MRYKDIFFVQILVLQFQNKHVPGPKKYFQFTHNKKILKEKCIFFYLFITISINRNIKILCVKLSCVLRALITSIVLYAKYEIIMNAAESDRISPWGKYDEFFVPFLTYIHFMKLILYNNSRMKAWNWLCVFECVRARNRQGHNNAIKHFIIVHIFSLKNLSYHSWNYF